MNTPLAPVTPTSTLNSDPERIAYALGHSRYAARLVQADPALEPALLAALHTPWSREEMDAFLDACSITDEDSLKSALRRLRKQVLLRLIARDLAGLANLREVMDTATTLAEATLSRAHRCLAEWLQPQFGTPRGEESGKPQDLIVVGMGKLGGGELNVSSDIDLIFAYPEEGETDGPRRLSNHEYFTRLGKQLIAALAEGTGDGFVFRVDMRLRPYGDSGPLVGSFPMLEQYYETQGREWERYAWTKGRVICGEGGDELMAFITPFVYRKYLDFGAFGSMRDLHAQIRREVTKRELHDNIKLGPGGIREVEFAVQVFQLIRGGQRPELQLRPTTAMLDLLEERELIPAQTVREMRDGYVFLRNLEHRLQYLEDAQTQTLPQNDADRQLIAEAMGFADYAGFMEVLDQHRGRIERHFEQIFAAPQSSQESHPLAPIWQGALDDADAAAQLEEIGYRRPEESRRRLESFRHGARYAHLPEASRTRIDALVPPLVEVATRFDNPDETLERVLHLLETVSRRSSYLALMTEYPQTLHQVARLCSASPWVSQFLALHPILLDELLDSRALLAPQDRAQLAVALRAQLDAVEGDTERQMDILRQFKQAQTFRLVAQDLAERVTLEKLSDSLSELADLVLAEVLRLAWSGLRVKHRETPAFAIVGYGKLGGKELGYASDLDIIFLYDDDHPDAQENYAKLGQRINTWLTSFTPAGLLYETDLRLRPDGASGLLVSTVEAFEKYQKENAWTWEHQALTRARFCAGEPGIGAAFDRIRHEVLTHPRDPAKLRQEVLEMRQKMLDSHPTKPDQFDIKQDRSGIIDVEFIVQFLVLAHSHAHPELTRNAGNLALLKLAGERGLIPADLAEKARDAYRLLRQTQHQLRLQDTLDSRVDPEPLRDHREAVQALWQAVFGLTAG